MTMLEELKDIKIPATKEFILFVLQNIADYQVLSINDLKVICAHTSGIYNLALDDIILYCKCFGFITINSGLSISPDLKQCSSSEHLNRYLVEKSVRMLFEAGIFQPNMFSFDITTHNFKFRNEMLPLDYASLRNILVTQDFFIINRSQFKTIFNINKNYEKIISSCCKKYKQKMTLMQLQARLEKNIIAGEQAEKFVLEYEKSRLGTDLGAKVKLISSIDVTAGYDIISFDSPLSDDYDRFIEVKSISHGGSFFWSSNEYEISRLMGDKYFLYLVDLKKINIEGYIPDKIQNPSYKIMNFDGWLVEPQSYHIRRINL